MIKLAQGQILKDNSTRPVFEVVSVGGPENSPELALLRPVEGLTYSQTPTYNPTPKKATPDSKQIDVKTVFSATDAASAALVTIDGHDLILVESQDPRSTYYHLNNDPGRQEELDLLKAEAQTFLTPDRAVA